MEADEAGRAGISGSHSVIVSLLPIMAVVLAAFLIIGMAMPVLPLYVHEELGLSTFVVGLVAGVQFAAALVSRFWSGRYADTRGGRRAVVTGLLIAAAAGALYLVSLGVADRPTTSVAVLIVGRALLGWAESCIITGAFGWGLSRGGPANAGKVISWLGTALWGAYGVGAPLGSGLYAEYGFVAVAVATTVLPLLTLLIVAPLPGDAPVASSSPAFTRVLGAVWLPGLGLALGCVGFGAISTFITLLFADRGWEHAWVVFSALSVTFILGRVAFGHLPDRIGGARVAGMAALVEAAGLALIWLSPSSSLVFVAAAVTGLGYSLVYPGFGVVAIRRVPPQNAALAMGAFTAFLDLALGLANPTLGLVAGMAGIRAVFLTSTCIVLSAALVAWRLLWKPASDLASPLPLTE